MAHVAVVVHEYTSRGREEPEENREIVGSFVPRQDETDAAFTSRVETSVAEMRTSRRSAFGMETLEFEGRLEIEWTEILGDES